MRLRPQEPEIFSFSFVDILATTIGVLVFIMVLALLNVARRVSPDQLRAAAEQHEQDAAKRSTEAEQWREKTREILPLVSRYESAHRREQIPAEEDLARLREEGRELREQNGRLAARHQRLRQETESAGYELSRLLRVLEGRRVWVRVPFRVPEERETRKKPVAFECDGQRVYFMGQGGKLASANYSRRGVPGFSFLERTKKARGETHAEAGKVGSRFLQILSRMDPRMHFALFMVREDSFELFRSLRRQAWERGCDTNWQPLTKREKILLDEGKGTATVM